MSGRIQAGYLLVELATLWRVSKRTVEDWLAQERAAGRGPKPDQAVVKLVGGRKALMIREDYASKIQDRYVYRVFRKKRLRAVLRALKHGPSSTGP